MASTGTITVDFGATPTTTASIAVTGQASILATSLCEAWIMGETTADNTENDHLSLAVSAKVTCGIPSAGTGFTIYVESKDFFVAGTYKIKWVWN